MYHHYFDLPGLHRSAYPFFLLICTMIELPVDWERNYSQEERRFSTLSGRGCSLVNQSDRVLLALCFVDTRHECTDLYFI